MPKMFSFTPRRPLLRQLEDKGVEFDQKLTRALEVSASRPDLTPEDRGFPDSYLTLALYRLNSVLTQIVDLDESRYNLFHEYKLAPPCEPDEVKPGQRLCRVLEKAAELAGTEKTIGSGHFLKAVVSLTLDEDPQPADGFPGLVIHNTFSAETILWGLGLTAWTSVDDSPELKDILAMLDNRSPVDDPNYLLTLEDKRLVFRSTSELGTYSVIRNSTAAPKQSALLTHLREQCGTVAPAELLELEDLINSSRTKESDLQRFFEKYSHFLRLWDFRQVHPQVYLTREDDGPLIPDFVLVDPTVNRATIVDLKLPTSKPIVARRNRERFSSMIEEARAQLLEYSEWFDDRRNRQSVKDRFGLEIYRPRLAMIIGRTIGEQSEFQQQKVRSRISDVDVVTYDEVIERARRRLALIRSASR